MEDKPVKTKETFTKKLIEEIEVNNDRIKNVVDRLRSTNDDFFGCEPQECCDETKGTEPYSLEGVAVNIMLLQNKRLSDLDHELNRTEKI